MCVVANRFGRLRGLQRASIAMNKVLRLLAVIVPGVACGPISQVAAQPAEAAIENVAGVIELADEDLATRPAFDLRATVTHCDANWDLIFLEQDGSYFSCRNTFGSVEVGSLVHARGVVRPGALRNSGELTSLKVLGRGADLKPHPIEFDDVQLGGFDCHLVAFAARIEAVWIGYGRTFLRCVQGRSRFQVSFSEELPVREAIELVDATVQVEGNLGCELNERGQPTGFLVYSASDRLTVTAPSSSPIPNARARSIETLSRAMAFELNGQVTWLDENGAFLEWDGEGAWVYGEFGSHASVGSVIRAIGYRDPVTRRLDAKIIIESSIEEIPEPKNWTLAEILRERPEACRVRVHGHIRSATRQDSGTLSFLMCEAGTQFEALVRDTATSELVGIDTRTAATIAVTGVATFEQTGEFDFRLFANSLDDVVVTERKVMWSNQAVLTSMAIAGLVLGVSLVWGVGLRSRFSARDRDFRNVSAELHLAYASVRDGILVLESDGTIKYANQLAAEFLACELSPGADAKMLAEQIPVKHDIVGFRTRWRRLCDSPSESDDFRIELNGERRILDVVTTPTRNEQGKFLNRLWMFRDMTEKEQLQQSVFHLQKQEAIGRLASGFAHDFNNMLTGVIGNLKVATLNPRLSVREVGDSIQTAIDASDSAAKLVSKILCFSRKSRLNLQSCDVGEILLQLQPLIQPSLGANVRLLYDLDESVPTVIGDDTLLLQVFLNIALNATEAIEDEGEISIRTYTQILDQPPSPEEEHEEPGPYCVVAIRDNGPGISESVAQHMFDPFFTTKGVSSTGLGLPMSDGVVRQHNGWIEAESLGSKGCEFRIFLPANPDQPKPVEVVSPATNRDLSGLRVLVVDDDAAIRKAMRRILEHHGATVRQASDGGEALEILGIQTDRRDGRSGNDGQSGVDIHGGTNVDIVILDWTMPGVSGKDTLLALKHACPNLPTLICSGYIFDCEKVVAECGARPDGVLQKPYHLALIVDEIVGLCERQAP